MEMLTPSKFYNTRLHMEHPIMGVSFSVFTRQTSLEEKVFPLQNTLAYSCKVDTKPPQECNKTGNVFTKLYFLHNLRLCPIS